MNREKPTLYFVALVLERKFIIFSKSVIDKDHNLWFYYVKFVNRFRYTVSLYGFSCKCWKPVD